MTVRIFDELEFEDVVVTGLHNYADDELFVYAEGYNLVTSLKDAAISTELKKELLEHPERFTLDDKPIAEISIHRYNICDRNQIQIVLFN